MAGVALGDINLRFAWQAWHLWHWAGSGGAWGPLVAHAAAAFCVAGVVLGDIHLHFAWQAWRWVTSTPSLRGRRGTHGTGLALVARLVAGVALGDIDLLLRGRCGAYGTGLALVARLGPFSRPSRRGTLRGSCGTHPPSLCVAGVALGDIDALFVCGRRFRFAWQAWHLWRVGLCGTQAKVASRCPNRVVRLSMGKVRKGDVL